MTSTKRAASSDLLTGRLLGDFVVQQRIGAGGFGAVYLAEQVSLGREAVVKIPLARVDANSVFAAQFLREAQFASQLDHPYAAHIYAFGVEEDGTLWTAMELVRGTPLNALLKKNGPLPVDKFVPLFDKLCEVVHTAHEQGIIHRDLKPANVMVIARAGRLLPKLLDLGIAKLSNVGGGGVAGGGLAVEDDTGREALPALEPLGSGSVTSAAASAVGASPDSGATQTMSPQPTVGPGLTKLRVMTLDASAMPAEDSESVGTPAYMAPEQWVPSIPTDARTDIYALGILAYEVLTGRLPFTGKNSMELARAHARATPPPLGGDLPVALNEVIGKALAKRPANRYQTAVELAAAVRKATGFDQEPVKLPALDAALRETLLATAPQPLAEAVSALDSVRNAHQGLSAVFQIMRVATRLLGNLSLACWTHHGTLAERGHPEVARALGQLKRHGLDEMEWLDLAELIAAQFTDRRDSAPLPELIELFHPDTLRNSDEPSEGSAVSRAMRAIVATKDHYENALAPDAATTKRLLEETMPQLQVVLAGLAWLHDYLLVVPHGETAERWMGTRRQPRAVVALAAGAEAERTDGEPMLVTQDGAPVLRLAPFFQVSAPAPGEDAELFVLDGSGRSGARLVSMPTGFEKSDHALWGWLGTQVAIEALDSERKGNERAPYRGLAAFTADDADMFVGRERETEAVANRLRITAMLGIVGPSGAGKSSFIQAGVLPALGSHWKSVIVRPGGSPLLALRTMVRGLEGLSETTDDALAGAGLGNVLRAWATSRKQSLMLYVDQFEELFTLCHDVAERKAYVDMLLNASLSPADPLRVVFTVRDDFLLRCQQLEALRDRLVSGLQLLATPTPDDLLRILIEPARRAGYEFDDPELPAEMVQAIADMPSALPLLSFTAAQLWELRDRQASKLARKAYESLGGVGGALAQHAERVLGGMSPEAQGLVRIVFRNLVTADGTRAILTRAEALEILGNHADAETTLEALIHARLLTASEGAGSLDRIEVVHEALLSAWPRLINWRREDAEGARMRDQLRAAARQWDERGRPRGLLWRDETLTEYTIWRARNPGNLTGVEAAFGAASIAEAARSRRLRRIAISTIFASLTIGMIVSLFMFRKAEVSRAAASNQVTEAYVEQGRRSQLENDPATAILYLREALHRGSRDPALPFMLARAVEPLLAETGAVTVDQGEIVRIRLSPDARHALITTTDGKLDIWDLDTMVRAQKFDAHAPGHFTASWLDNDTIATFGVDGIAAMWRWRDAQRAHFISLAPEQMFTMEWNARRGELLLVTKNASVYAWHPTTAGVRTLRRGGTSDAITVNLVVDATTGAVALYGRSGDGASAFAEIHHQDRTVALPAQTSGLLAAQFSPDGALFAAGRIDGSVVVLDARSGIERKTLSGHLGVVHGIAWSHDGTLLAWAGDDSNIHVWNAESDTRLIMKGHAARVNGLLFPGADNYLYSWSNDGSIRVWEAQRGILAASLLHGGMVFRFESNSSRLRSVSASKLGSMKVWQLDADRWLHSFEKVENDDLYETKPVVRGKTHLLRATSEGLAVWELATNQRVVLPGNTEAVVGYAHAAAEAAVTAVTSRGELKTYDLARRALVATKQLLTGPSVVAAVGSPDGQTLVVADDVGTVSWLRASGELIHAQTYDAPTTSVIWSPGQDYVVLGRGEDYDTKRTLVDVKTGRQLAPLPDAWALIAIAPDGRYILASQHRKSGVSVFSASGEETTTLTPRANVTSMRLTPQGDKALLGLADGSVEVYRTSRWELADVLEGHFTDVIDLDVSADGMIAYSISSDAKLFVWDLRGFGDYRNIYRLNLDPQVVWVVPDPRQEQVFTISGSGIMDARPLGSLAPPQLSDIYLKPIMCKIPRAIRKKTPTTIRCDDATIGP